MLFRSEKDKIEKILSGNLKSEDISDNSNGIGLDNVINRLKLFLESDDVIDIVSEGENKGTDVRIYLPVDEKGYDDV